MLECRYASFSSQYRLSDLDDSVGDVKADIADLQKSIVSSGGSQSIDWIDGIWYFIIVRVSAVWLDNICNRDCKIASSSPAYEH